GRGAVSEVVKAEVGNPGLTQRLVKRVAHIERCPAISTGKEQRRINAAHAGQGVDRLQGQADEGQGPSFAVFAVLNGELRTAEVDIPPGQAEKFLLPGSRTQGQQDHRVEAPVVARLAGREQARAFLVGQVAYPAPWFT